MSKITFFALCERNNTLVKDYHQGIQVGYFAIRPGLDWGYVLTHIRSGCSVIGVEQAVVAVKLAKTLSKKWNWNQPIEQLPLDEIWDFLYPYLYGKCCIEE